MQALTWSVEGNALGCIFIPTAGDEASKGRDERDQIPVKSRSEREVPALEIVAGYSPEIAV